MREPFGNFLTTFNSTHSERQLVVSFSSYLDCKMVRINGLVKQYTMSALKPGRIIRVNLVTFSPGLTRIGSREKRNCSFDDVETYKRYRVALS